MIAGGIAASGITGYFLGKGGKGAKGDCEEKLRYCEERIERLEREKRICEERIERLERKKRICEERIENLEREKRICEIQVEVYRETIRRLESAKEKCNVFLLKLLQWLLLVKKILVRIVDNVVDEEKVENRTNDVDKEKVENRTKEIDGLGVELELDEESKAVSEGLMAVTNLMEVAELKVNEYKESRKKEQSILKNSVVSLTEENRNINISLKIALVEMEAVEKSLSRLNENIDQKRVAILQIVESGLQRVGFGSGENSLESSEIKVDTSVDSSEREEEVVSLASTMVRIMKNLNLKITQLRRSLEESRSNNEHLQSLTKKQAQDIVENMLYIKELENRERMLAQNVEGLMVKIKEAEAEVVRWREACELEIESGKHEIEQRDTVVKRFYPFLI
nr:uncharacterized protein At3g49055-like [Ziziphus jujuba var. spinosa]